MRQDSTGRLAFAPTDLVNFLGCDHATVLDIRRLSEGLAPEEPTEYDRLLQNKGLAHEAECLRTFEVDGRTVAVVSKDLSAAERLAQTAEALKVGFDIIYQGALESGSWHGYADFLERTRAPSKLGPFSYEVVDTKLSKHADPKHLIQLCVYSDLLAEKQGVEPRETHLVLGDKRRESFRLADFAAYVRHAQGRLESFAAEPPGDSYPMPCQHCGHCRWSQTCEAQWQRDNHLSLVANIRHSHIVKLEQAGVKTVAALAALAADSRVPDLNPEVLQRLRHQAILQEHKRCTGENKYDLIPFDAGQGFHRLPKPDPGDLFFDMEGDPLHPNGLEYLFGLALHSDARLVHKRWWAHNHDEERAAVAEFMAFVGAHLEVHPGAHIYHYNHYEPTALKRLAARYAVAEHLLDELLRQHKFVDLFKVVREAIRTSEPRYSLKNIETFYLGQSRLGEVANASDSVVAYNRWRETGDGRLLDEIGSYNEVDCLSTARLRDWLLGQRPEHATWFDGAVTDDVALEKAENRRERELRFVEYQDRLARAADAGHGEHFRHLADLLGFHAREGKPAWWEFFDRQGRFEDELLDDAECLAGLTLVGEPERVKKSLLHTFEFPTQETKLQAGSEVFDVASGLRAGVIDDLDEEKLVVQIKRGADKGPLPARLSVGPGGPINTQVLTNALFRFADDAVAGHRQYRAIEALLRRDTPRLFGHVAGEPIVTGSDLLAATTEAVARLDESYLFIQGPPGAGKTYTSAHVIVELIRRGKKVGVAANSHKAIHNLLDMIEQTASREGVRFTGVKKSSCGDDATVYSGAFIESEDDKDCISLDAHLLAGTAWLFADERFDRHLDYLFIDEAGQVSLANVVAMGTAARSIVLVGDQMQLGQPTKGVHSGESGKSVLDFLLGEQATVSPDRGIFLNQTWRLNPSICRFISDAFYDGRLEPDPVTVGRKLVFRHPIDGITPEGIHFLAVSHTGCAQKSEEEGAVVERYYQQLLGQEFHNGDVGNRSIGTDDILVVSPYNVQVNYLRRLLPGGARVGTVDKFQGQEAAIVLLSMATSSAEDMPRTLEFLLSANRLNVALSRAQCLAIVVASPRLLEAPCRTIEQMRLVNKFCQLWTYSRAGKGRAPMNRC